MDVQWWIETVGKLAPASIAFAVYLASRRQNAWNVAVARRASAMEDQKLRLSLLDRRASVIDVIRSAPGQFVMAEAQDVINELSSALTVAELTFGPTETAAIRRSLNDLHSWNSFARQEKTYRDTDILKYQKAVELRSDAEARIFDGLSQLERDLVAIARVTPLTPLASPANGSARWVRSIVRKNG